MMFSGLRTVALSGLLLSSPVWGQANLGQGGQAGQPGGQASQPGAPAGQGAQGQGAAMTGFNPIGQTPWFANPAARQHLNLNDTQFNTLSRNYSQAWNTYNRGMTGLDANLSPQLRSQRQSKLNDQFRRDFSQGFDAVFPNEEARNRFHQLDLQYRGYSAFSDPTVAQRLNLTEDQRQKFDQWGNEWNRNYTNWRRDYARNRDQVNTQFEDSRKQFRDRVQNTLTPEQQKTWQEMTGRPFDFDADVYFPNPNATRTLKPALPGDNEPREDNDIRDRNATGAKPTRD